MATKKEASPKSWETEHISEFKVEGTAAVWRSQISTSPDGKTFAGVRKYFVKKDGTERADRAGISVMIDETDLQATAKQLLQLEQLFKGLQSTIVSSSSRQSSKSKTTKTVEPGAIKDKPVARSKEKLASGGGYVIYRGTQFLVKCVKSEDRSRLAVSTTTDPSKARVWSSSQGAQEYLDARPKALRAYEVSGL